MFNRLFQAGKAILAKIYSFIASAYTYFFPPKKIEATINIDKYLQSKMPDLEYKPIELDVSSLQHPHTPYSVAAHVHMYSHDTRAKNLSELLRTQDLPVNANILTSFKAIQKNDNHLLMREHPAAVNAPLNMTSASQLKLTQFQDHMPNLPIARFTKAHNDTEFIALALQTITKTQAVLSKGGSNRFADLINNPNASSEIEKCWDHKLTEKLPPIDDLLKISKLRPEIRKEMRDIVFRIAKSYKFKIGNCADLSAVALHFACRDGSDKLLYESTVEIPYIDNVFLKITSKNN